MNKKIKFNPNIYLIIFFISLILLYSNLIPFFEFIFLIPLLFYLKNKNTNYELLSLFIFLATIINFSFFYEYGLKYIFIVGILSTCFFLAFFLIAKKLMNKKLNIILFPSIFTILFYLIGLTPINNFWINISGFLNIFPITIQYLGSLGIVFIIILINTLIFEIINNIKNKKINYIYIVFAIILIGHFFILQIKPITNENQTEIVKVAGIQGNLDQSWVNRTLNKTENLNKYLALSNQAIIKYNPEIILWQEYLFTNAIQFDLELQKKIKDFSNKNNVTIILGSITLENESSLSSKRYNTLYIINNNSIQTYSAYEPFPLFDKNYVKEKSNNPIIINNNSIGLSLCYEENHRYVFTTQVKENDAQTFFAIGNQYAMTNYHALKTTSLNSNIRAAENNKYIFRLETSGLSTIIDNSGKNIKQVPINSEQILYYEIPLIENKTFYSQNKNLIEILIIVISIIILLFNFGIKFQSSIKKSIKRK